MSKAVFLDRDGTINVDHGYLHDPALLEFLPGAVEALQLLASNGFKLIVITNQSGIGRGYFTSAQYNTFSTVFIEALKQHGVEILATYMCPHSPDQECDCRKPLAYMPLKAIEEYGIDAAASYMFGDKLSDVECGEASGLISRQVTEQKNLLYWTKEIIDKRL